MRLIDANKICTNIFWMPTANKMFRDEIEKQPTVDAEPVKHGHWIESNAIERKCSVCGWPTGEDNIDWSTGEFEPPNYCEHCGTKMDEEGNQ